MLGATVAEVDELIRLQADARERRLSATFSPVTALSTVSRPVSGDMSRRESHLL
jgi:hypothetical protein